MSRAKFNVLRGTLDQENPLSKLRGNGLIWSDVFQRVDSWYEEQIEWDDEARHVVAHVSFPPPKGININMMPIRMREPDTIPVEMQPYMALIKHCSIPSGCTPASVAYLTIHESEVKVGECHRRPGLHIESPVMGVCSGGGTYVNKPLALGWGGGHMRERREGGIYFASNVASSSAVWPMRVKDPVQVADRHGCIEHMREYLGPSYILGKNEMCWITDRTPHESLPIEGGDWRVDRVHRQFFRLVVGPISVWYSQHNTPNPLGIQPDKSVFICNEDKFSDSFNGLNIRDD